MTFVTLMIRYQRTEVSDQTITERLARDRAEALLADAGGISASARINDKITG